MRVEARLAAVDALHGAETPGAEERRDPRSPRPLAHAVEALPVLHLVAVRELLVAEDVAVRVDDPLREPGRAGRVVELGRVVGRGVDADVLCRGAEQRLIVEHERVRRPGPVEAGGVRGVGDEEPGARVREPVLDPVVAVEDGHRQQDRAELPGAEEDRGRLGRRRQHDGDPVTALDAAGGERVGRPVRQILQLSPRQLAGGAVVALPDHRRLVARVLVADVGGDVVALRHHPAVGGADLLVARAGHAGIISRARGVRVP